MRDCQKRNRHCERGTSVAIPCKFQLKLFVFVFELEIETETSCMRVLNGGLPRPHACFYQLFLNNSSLEVLTTF
jgi:hypothetical protein